MSTSDSRGISRLSWTGGRPLLDEPYPLKLFHAPLCGLLDLSIEEYQGRFRARAHPRNAMQEHLFESDRFQAFREAEDAGLLGGVDLLLSGLLEAMKHAKPEQLKVLLARRKEELSGAFGPLPAPAPAAHRSGPGGAPPGA